MFLIMNKLLCISLLLFVALQIMFVPVRVAYAATTPNLGTAATFGILSTTFTRNIGVTAITGDVGYTTLSGSGTSTVTGTTSIPAPPQAGTDQAAALSALNAQVCDFTFGGATVLSDLPQPLAPGVYCVTGAQSIGTGGITLNGAGTFVFRSTGPLNTTAASVVSLTGGASACDVFWTPVATTLGANTTFIGTVIESSAITVGSTVAWTGRALAYGVTVTTDTDTIAVPVCVVATPTPTLTPTPTPTFVPIPTPTPIQSVSVDSSFSFASSPAVCIGLPITTVPRILDSKRVSPTSISLNWGPFAGIGVFNIQYGLTKGDWLYNTTVTGFSTTINALPANLPIWIQVAATDGCAIGVYGEPQFVGGPSLPNTGFAPRGIFNSLRRIF